MNKNIMRIDDNFWAIGCAAKIIKKFRQIVNSVLWRDVRKRFASVGESVYASTPFQVKGEEYIRIGDRFQAAPGLILEAWDEHSGNIYHPEIIIGNDVCVASNCHIGAIHRIEIDDGVLIGGNVLIEDHFHGRIIPEENPVMPNRRVLYSKGPIHIGKRVWIGENVVILPGVVIGEESIIGANSVVNKDVPSRSVVAGCPARIIKTLE